MNSKFETTLRFDRKLKTNEYSNETIAKKLNLEKN